MTEFYQIVSGTRQESGYKFIIKLNPLHPVYKGHFPEIAIVPGAVLIGIISDLSAIMLQGKTKLKTASGIKFLKMIQPSQKEVLEINLISKTGSPLEIKSEIRIQNKLCFKMDAVYSI